MTRPEGQSDQRLDAVGKAGLLEQAEREDHQAAQDQMRIRPLGLGTLELRDHVLVVKDRPGDQMRKISDEQRVMRQGVARNIAAESIDQKGDLGEGVERNADRQQDVDGDPGRKQRVEIGGEEAGIFEDAEHDEIAGDANGERGKSRR